MIKKKYWYCYQYIVEYLNLLLIILRAFHLVCNKPSWVWLNVS